MPCALSEGIQLIAFMIALQKSRFWQLLPKKVRRDLQQKPVTMENHSYGEASSLLVIIGSFGPAL
jgi:hypothetical protein